MPSIITRFFAQLSSFLPEENGAVSLAKNEKGHDCSGSGLYSHVCQIIKVASSDEHRFLGTLTAMVTIQKAHLHPKSSTTNPATTGPIEGPSKGPRLQIDIARPRHSAGIMSAMLPAPQVTTATPAKPDRNRKAMSMPMLVANAQPILKITNRTLQPW